MPKSIHIDHHDTAIYIPMYHRTHGFTGREREIYKSLEQRLFYEGRIIDPLYLVDQPNLRPTFATIGFDCICRHGREDLPRIRPNSSHSLSGSLCIHSRMAYLITLNGMDSNLDIYPPPHEESLLIHEAPFNQRPLGKTCKVKGVDITLDPFQMVLSGLKNNLMKWEIILNENAVSLTRNKDHPNAYLCYMLYCLTIGKPLNLVYYIANRMVSVAKSADITLPYEILLTLLFEHVHFAHPYALSNDLSLMDYVMIPLTKKRVF
nr:hypothetical protein [Tanacetum cinerariifolium]